MQREIIYICRTTTTVLKQNKYITDLKLFTIFTNAARRSGVTDIVMSMVLRGIPRKIMVHDGGESFSREDSTPRSWKSLPRASKGAWDL